MEIISEVDYFLDMEKAMGSLPISPTKIKNIIKMEGIMEGIVETKEVNINFTGIFIKDPEGGGYTTYIAEFPAAVAEGNTIEEAEDNLKVIFKDVLNYLKEESKGKI